MFEKLVVSSRERRGRRTIKFLLGTSLFYMSSAVCAVALSVVMANPKLADIELDHAPALVLAAPRPATPEVHAAARQATLTPRVDGTEPMPLEKLINNSDPPVPARVRFNGPPSIGPITGSAGNGDFPGAAGTGGVPGTIGTGTADPHRSIGEPPPPPAPRPQPQEVDKRPVRMASTVLQGKAIERPAPAYPPLARAAGVEGTAAIEIVIAPDGRVESARVISGHALLVGAALEVARRWRFEPTRLSGTPVRVIGTISFVFKLRE